MSPSASAAGGKFVISPEPPVTSPQRGVRWGTVAAAYLGMRRGLRAQRGAARGTELRSRKSRGWVCVRLSPGTGWGCAGAHTPGPAGAVCSPSSRARRLPAARPGRPRLTPSVPATRRARRRPGLQAEHCAEPCSWAADECTEAAKGRAWRELGTRWPPLFSALAPCPPGRQLKEIQQWAVLLMGVQCVVLMGPEFQLCGLWDIVFPL